jgi:hypothetical protein
MISSGVKNQEMTTEAGGGIQLMASIDWRALVATRWLLS